MTTATEQRRNIWWEAIKIILGLAVGGTIFVLLFGTLLESTYYGDFGIRILRYGDFWNTLPAAILQAPYAAFWAGLFTLVGVAGIYVALVALEGEAPSSQIIALVTAVTILGFAYREVRTAAEERATSLPAVRIHSLEPVFPPSEYLQIGRSAGWYFFWDRLACEVRVARVVDVDVEPLGKQIGPWQACTATLTAAGQAPPDADAP